VFKSHLNDLIELRPSPGLI